MVSGAISSPATAPISAASAKLRSPDSSVGMPMSRAPTRFIAVARSALPPSEIPAGLLTALIGGPFFLFLLLREGR